MADLAPPLLVVQSRICTALSCGEKETTVAPSESAIRAYWIAIDEASKYACYSGENMTLGYDIFRESSDGSPLWVAQAATLNEAKDKLEMLAGSVPAQYFIRDAASTKIVGRAGPNTSEEIKP